METKQIPLNQEVRKILGLDKAEIEKTMPIVQEVLFTRTHRIKEAQDLKTHRQVRDTYKAWGVRGRNCRRQQKNGELA